MDIRDTKHAVEISLELPGMTREDVKIAVEDDVLTVSGEKKTERKPRKRTTTSPSGPTALFSRSVTLPRSVDAEKIKAAMKDGVLKLTAPKMEPPRPSPSRSSPQTDPPPMLCRLASAPDNLRSAQLLLVV